eukprot:3501997-Amphidinium_carterae.1
MRSCAVHRATVSVAASTTQRAQASRAPVASGPWTLSRLEDSIPGACENAPLLLKKLFQR